MNNVRITGVCDKSFYRHLPDTFRMLVDFEWGQQLGLRFQVFTVVTMKNTVFCDLAPRGSCQNRRFRGSDTTIFSLLVTANAVPGWLILLTLNMGTTRSSETSVLPILTRRHIPEDDILQTILASQSRMGIVLPLTTRPTSSESALVSNPAMKC
jgi:hypothetical protein